MTDAYDDLYGGWKGYERAKMARGAVACGNPDAAEAGVRVYEAGGNAIDALIATAFAMGVVEPLDSGLGAGGFITLHHKASGTTTCLDFMGTAPKAAQYQLYQAFDPLGDYAIKVKGRENEAGHRSVAVPGAAAGLCQALERFGTLDRKTVMAPAIKLAKDGFTVAAKAALRMARSEELLRQTEECQRVLMKPGKQLFQAGDHMKMLDYAKSLEVVAEGGAEAFYQGPLGQAILADMKRFDGFLTQEDFDEFAVVERAPATGSYCGHEIAIMGAPSSGELVTKGLAALERPDIPGDRANLARMLAEAMLEMFEARRTGLGDPAFVKPSAESKETTSLSAIDAQGNAVSLTFSNNNHSGVVVPGTGILLNNQMRLFHAWEGSPNSVAPGKRPASSMMPSIIFKDGRAALAMGASGATRIVTALVQILFHHLGRGLPLEEALRQPRLHAEEDAMISDADFEPIAAEVANALNLSYTAVPGRDPMMAVCQAISVGEDGTAIACGDPRARAQGRVV